MAKIKSLSSLPVQKTSESPKKKQKPGPKAFHPKDFVVAYRVNSFYHSLLKAEAEERCLKMNDCARDILLTHFKQVEKDLSGN